MSQNNTIVITRHTALIQYLEEINLIPAGTPVLSHATPEDVRGRDVIGILPLSLASLANSVTEVPLTITPELRGQELTIEQVRQLAGNPVRYQVNVIE